MSTNKPILTVIVPVYNVEKYIAQCIESIQQQTFENLELIIVNDGSTDKSVEICEQYAANDKRIRLLHKKNGGLSSARNFGLEAAQGEYIAFVDGDDWIEPDMYELLFKDITNYQADVAICGYIRDNGRKNSNIANKNLSPMILTSADAVKIMLSGSPFGAYVWNKVCKKSLINNLRFEDGFAEDVFFTWNLFHVSPKIIYNYQNKYHYRQREDSLTNNGFELKKMVEIERRRQVYYHTSTHYPELDEIAFARYIQCAIQYGIQLVYDKKYKQEFLQIKTLLTENTEKIKRNNFLTKRFKKHFILLTMPYNLTRKIYWIRNLTNGIFAFR